MSRAAREPSAPRANRTSFGGWAARLALAVAGVAVGLVAAELTLRFLRPQLVLVVSPGLYAAAPPPLRYRMQPGFHGRITNRVEFDHAVSIDRLGLRGGARAHAQGTEDARRLRLLALGDSFTFGVGVEDDEAWVERLAARLTAADIPAYGLNAGAPGYGVPDAAAWLEVYGAQVDPDLVVLGIFPGNDLHDAAPGGPKMEVVDGELRRAGERQQLKRWLYYHSHLFAFLKTALPKSLDRRLRSALGLAQPWETQLDRLELTLYEADRSDPLVESGLDETRKALERLDAQCRRTSVPLVAVLVPALPQVDDAAWQALVSSSGDDASVLDRDRPSRLVKDVCAALGIPVVDLAPAFAAAIQRGERLYFPVDRHLTVAGHDLAASEIAAFLERSELLQR